MKVHERVRVYRKELGLSQEYISKLLNVPRTTITAIEAGERSLKADELKILTQVFGVSSDEILNGRPSPEVDTMMFARSFSELSDNDKKEIMNLIEFKKTLKGE